MSVLLPVATTVGDLCAEAMSEAGLVGLGQQASGEDTTKVWARLQWMLQGWSRKRWLVYHLVTRVVVSTGAASYTLGPGGNLDTGAGSLRPDKIESAFVRQPASAGGLPVDWPLELLQSMEDYNRLPLKALTSFPNCVYYDPSFPLGTLYVNPIPNAAMYSIGVAMKEQLPASFPTLATALTLPYEYYACILYNLALRVRSMRQIPTYPGDQLPMLAKDSFASLRQGNTAIAELTTPVAARSGSYNIFSDRSY